MTVTFNFGRGAKPIKHPTGRKVTVGDMKAGADIAIDTRTGKIIPPKVNRPKAT